MSDKITIQPEYFSVANEIIRPERYVSTSRYFCLKWERTLGLVGTRIVRVLRALGYYDPKTGETRDGIIIGLTELADLCGPGVSPATIKREFGNGKDGMPINPHLHSFVQRETQYRREPTTGHLLRKENIYRVKMDDPVHPDDLIRLKQLWEERQKGSDPRKAQSAPYAKSRRAQNEPQGAQNEPLEGQDKPQGAQTESISMQNEPTLKDYSCSHMTSSNTTTTQSLNLAGDSSVAGDVDVAFKDSYPPEEEAEERRRSSEEDNCFDVGEVSENEDADFFDPFSDDDHDRNEVCDTPAAPSGRSEASCKPKGGSTPPGPLSAAFVPTTDAVAGFDALPPCEKDPWLTLAREDLAASSEQNPSTRTLKARAVWLYAEARISKQLAGQAATPDADQSPEEV